MAVEGVREDVEPLPTLAFFGEAITGDLHVRRDAVGTVWQVRPHYAG